MKVHYLTQIVIPAKTNAMHLHWATYCHGGQLESIDGFQRPVNLQVII
jgi:hypothetical protein